MEIIKTVIDIKPIINNITNNLNTNDYQAIDIIFADISLFVVQPIRNIPDIAHEKYQAYIWIAIHITTGHEVFIIVDWEIPSATFD